ncbi:MAG: hypothetical protein OEU46_01950 [Alphaproteobacteria bacterium]|nr:hypothetical protein [Alphaproteobacteria bacterium]
MQKISLVVCAVAAVGAFSIIHAKALSNAEPAAATIQSASTVTAPFETARRGSDDNPKCRSAKRDITAYSRAVGDLDPWRASHRRLAAIYHEAWQVKHEWYQKNCR